VVRACFEDDEVGAFADLDAAEISVALEVARRIERNIAHRRVRCRPGLHHAHHAGEE
jgi:acetoin utilization deacetylase AcuC-like enzyme